MPCISYIQKCCTILYTVSATLAALRLSKADSWGQFHSYATSVKQVPFQDIIFSLKDSDVFKPVVLALVAVLQNGKTTVALCDTILSTINDSGNHLIGLKEVTERDNRKAQGRNNKTPEDSGRKVPTGIKTPSEAWHQCGMDDRGRGQ